MRNPIAVLLLLASTAVLAAPAFQVVLVPSSLADCNSARREKVYSTRQRQMVRDFKPHGHWLC